MYTRFPKKTQFVKFISGVALTSFIFTGVPIRSYAGIFVSDNLRREAATKEDGRVKEISEELIDQHLVWKKDLKDARKAKQIEIHQFAKEVLEDMIPGSTILSLGCGAGLDEESFAKAGHTVIATDFVESAISELSGKINKENIKNLTTKVQDLTKTFAFSDESFDVVYSHLSLNFMKDVDIARAIKEIYRVLKPGGRIYFIAQSVNDKTYGKGEKIEKNTFVRDEKLVHYFSQEDLKEKFVDFKFNDEDIVTGERVFYPPEGRSIGFIQLKAKEPLPTIFEQLEKIYTKSGASMDDYYVPPLIVTDPKGEPVGKIKKGDIVIWTNHRTDRSLGAMIAFTDPNFNRHGNRFGIDDLGLTFVPFTTYDEKHFKAYGIQAAFTSEFTLPKYKSIIEVLKDAGVIQGYFTESDKGQHVTYFFAGQRNLDYAALGIKVSIVPSESVEDNKKAPQMKYAEITDNVINYLDEIKETPKKKMVVVNLPVDIQGHNIKVDRERAKKTVLAADKEAGRIREETLRQKGVYIEISDHGNIEQLVTLDEKGMPLSDKYGVIPFDQHTTNPVNFIVDGLGKDIKLKKGKGLSNIAATLLEILGIPKPEEMSESLLEDYKYQDIQGPVVVVIRDGWGVNKYNNPEANEYNGIELAKPPVYLDLLTNCPFTALKAHGDAVGLPDYQMGDSDNGHRVIGTGYNPPTLYKQIIDKINDKTFFENPVLRQVFELARQGNHNIHIMGLYSSGGIHSDNRYFLALMEMAKQMNLGSDIKVNIWPILDGRDVMTRIPDENGIHYLKQIEDKIKELNSGNIQLAGVVGRNFAMDRDAVNRDQDADKKEKLAAQKEGTEAGKLLKEAVSSREKAGKLWQERFKPAYRLWVNGEGIPVKIGFDDGNAEKLKNFLNANSRFFKAVGAEALLPGYLDDIWGQFEVLYSKTFRLEDLKLALVVHSSFFKKPGAIDALNAIIRLQPRHGVRIMLDIYGEGADKIRALFSENSNIIAVKTAGELKSELENRQVNLQENVVILKPAGEKIDLKVKQVGFSDKTISIVALAKAMQVLAGANSEGRSYSGIILDRFKEFYGNMERQGIISKETYKNTYSQVFLGLDLPDIEPVQGVSEATKADADLVANFINKFI